MQGGEKGMGGSGSKKEVLRQAISGPCLWGTLLGRKCSQAREGRSKSVFRGKKEFIGGR